MEKATIEVPWGGEDDDLRAQLRTMPGAGALLELADDPTAMWTIAVTWHWDETEANPVSVEVRSRTGKPVTPSLWRSIRIAEVIDETRDRLGWVADRAAARLKVDPAIAESIGQKQSRRRGRPATYDDAHYRRVGAAYMAALEGGKAHPVREVAKDFVSDWGEGIANAKTDHRVKWWVREARKRGYITEKGVNRDGTR